MPRDSKSLVLDAWSVLAYFQDEPAGVRVADALADALDAKGGAYLCVANAGEVWYILSRENSETAADKAIQILLGLGIQFVDIDWALTRVAARFKARGGLSYADAYAAALAKTLECALITGDREFETVAGDISIRWV